MGAQVYSVVFFGGMEDLSNFRGDFVSKIILTIYFKKLICPAAKFLKNKVVRFPKTVFFWALE